MTTRTDDVRGQAAAAATRRLRVFLCHSSADKPGVRVLYAQLCEDGFDPWLDEEKLLPGQDWELEIVKAVRSSDVVIVCLSRVSVTTPGFSHKEMKIALDAAMRQPEGTVFVIPLRLEECELPESLRGLHRADLFTPEGYERLKGVLRRRAEELNVEPPKLRPARRRALRILLLILLPLAVLVVGFVSFTSGRLGGAEPAPTPSPTPTATASPSEGTAEIRDRPRATPTPRPTSYFGER